MRQDFFSIAKMAGKILPFLFITSLASSQDPAMFFSGDYPIFSGIAGFQADGNVHWFHPVPGNPNDIDLTSDGRNLVIVSDNGTFEIVRHTGERVMHDLLPPLQDVDTLPQADQYLLTSRLGNQVFLYDSQSKTRQYFSLGFEGPVDTDLLPNGNFLVCETPPGHSGRVRDLRGIWSALPALNRCVIFCCTFFHFFQRRVRTDLPALH